MWGLFIAPTSKELEVMNELVAKFRRWEELCSWLEGPGAKIYALFVRSPAGQGRWDDRLDEATEQLEMGIAERRQVDAELEALRASAILVQDVVLSVSTDHPHWQHPCPWRRNDSKIGFTLRPPMESTGGPDQCWLLPCRTF
jgi:hypothetical protein